MPELPKEGMQFLQRVDKAGKRRHFAVLTVEVTEQPIGGLKKAFERVYRTVTDQLKKPKDEGGESGEDVLRRFWAVRGRPGQSSHRLSEIRDCYLRHVEARRTTPVLDTAAELGISEEEVRRHLPAARDRGVLGRPGQARAGDSPTEDDERFQPERATSCRCDRPTLYTNEDGDPRCHRCGLARRGPAPLTSLGRRKLAT